MTLPCIRLLKPDEYDYGLGVYHGYANFYQVVLTKDEMLTAWSWLIDAMHVRVGFVAKQPGQSASLTHFCGMPCPFRWQMIGFLDVLIVWLKQRSSGVTVALIAVA